MTKIIRLVATALLSLLASALSAHPNMFFDEFGNFVGGNHTGRLK